MNKFKNIREQCFFGSLILVVITLSLPKYSLNSQSIIICVICWLLYTPFQQKWSNLKKNFLPFLLVSSLFWISLLGLLYTENIVEGIKNFQKQLPFLVFPLIFFSVEISGKTKLVLLKYFSYGIVVSTIFALLKAVYFKLNNFGNYFYYDKLGELLDIHTTYFAMYVLLALLYFANSLSQKTLKRNLIYGVCIIFLLWFLYLLSVRVSIVALLVGSLLLIFGKRKRIKTKIILLLLGGISLVVLFYFTPNFQKRFNAKTPEGVAISDLDARSVHWQSALEVIGQNNLFFGSGTGDGHLKLYDQYLTNGFETGYIYQYNAHNQFLETTLYFGIIGLLLLLAIIFFTLKKCYVQRNFLGIAIMGVQVVIMITESTLESQSGIVLFAFTIGLLVSTKNNKNEILVIGPYPPPVGGISLFIKKFEIFFKENFAEKITIVNEFNNQAKDINDIYSLASNSKAIYFFKLLKFLLFYNRASLIYYNGVHGITRFFLVAMGKILGYKVIIHFHGRSVINFYNKNLVSKQLSKFTLNNAKKLLCVNPVISKYLKDINPNWNIIDLPAFLPNNRIAYSNKINSFLEELPSNKKYFLSYATLDKTLNGKYNYGISDLIEFFKNENENTEFGLILVLILYKKDHITEYQTYIKPLLSNNIQVFINDGSEPLTPFFDKAEGYIRWTFEDGWAGSLVESLEAGLITIATTVSERPKGVLLFNPKNPEQLKKLINKKHSNHSLPKTDFQNQFKNLFLSLGYSSKKN